MNSIDTLGFFLRFGYNLVALFVVVRYGYFKQSRRRDFLFTFFIFNILIFFVCSFLRNIMIDVGFAFGLFAIFSILRYRTETIPIREMTYQFLVITLGAINGLATINGWHLELIFCNIVIIAGTIIMDGSRLLSPEQSKAVEYEKIELIRPGNSEALLEDLRNRTGLDIYRVQIEKINFLRDTALPTVFYNAAADEERG